MNGGDIISWVLIASSIICFLLSIVVACGKLPAIDRVFPAALQIIFWIPAFSLTHGFPSEMFREMVFDFVWIFFALSSSYRLYRIKMPILRVFVVLQFIQSVSVLLLSTLDYVSACWRYYGHIVWNP